MWFMLSSQILGLYIICLKFLYSYRKRVTKFLLTKEAIWFVEIFPKIRHLELEKLNIWMSNFSGVYLYKRRPMGAPKESCQRFAPGCIMHRWHLITIHLLFLGWSKHMQDRGSKWEATVLVSFQKLLLDFSGNHPAG